MTDKQILQEIINIRAAHRTTWSSIITHSRKELGDWLKEQTSVLDESYSWATRLYWAMHGLKDFPLCPFCDENGKCCMGFDGKVKRNIDSFERGYFRACTAKCKAMQKLKVQQSEETNLKKYGAKNFFASEAGKKKQKDWLEKMGVENAFQLESVKQKSRDSRKKAFGYEYTMQSPEKRKLASDNYKDKTGYEHQFCDPNVIAKTAQTIQQKKDAGIDVFAARRVGNRKRRYAKFLQNEEVVPNFSLEDFLKLDATTQYFTKLNWHCKKCGTDFDACVDQNLITREGLSARCYNCHPFLAGTSHDEQELAEFVKSLTNDVSCNTKRVIPPLEIDVYVESKKLGFEFNGLFWHSEKNDLDAMYHINKTFLCDAAEVRLIHIFEDEWCHKKDIVKSYIKSLFGQYDIEVDAKQCEIREVTKVDSVKFQEENHVLGSTKSSNSFGLYFNDELVSLMSFNKNKTYDWELVSFCNTLGYGVSDAKQVLLSHFEKLFHPKSLVSCLDRRWFHRSDLEDLGFSLEKTTSPDFMYTDIKQRFPKSMYKKSTLKTILKKFDASKTDLENLHDNDLWRIYDCGKLVLVKTH